jgi:hypothetical protein
MAQQHDSIYYDPSILEIKVEQFKTLYNVDTLPVNYTYSFSPTYDGVKDEGLFTNAGHLLFKADNFKPNSSNHYRFVFHNTSTDKRDTAYTDIIGPIYQQTLGFSTKVNIASIHPYIIRIGSAVNGKVYGLIFRFKYVTINSLTHDTLRNHIDFELPVQTSIKTDGTEVLSFQMDGTSIFQKLGTSIPDLPANTSMTAILGDYIFTAGTDDFYNYYVVNSPSNTVDYIPELTNLKNGSKGIFTCRMDTTISNIPFSDASLDSLFNGQYTSHIFN